LWRKLLSVPYTYSDEDSGNYSEITYAVGQPMGAYSSWAMLALTHHIIVHYSALKADGNNSFLDYAVLGDDVVIQSETVSQEYLRVMTYLGVEVSLPKSMVSLTIQNLRKESLRKKVLLFLASLPGFS